MKKIIIVLLFLLLVLPASHVAAEVTWGWANVYSSNQKNIDGSTFYLMQADAGMNTYFNNNYVQSMYGTAPLTYSGLWLDGSHIYNVGFSTPSFPPPGPIYEIGYTFFASNFGSPPVTSTSIVVPEGSIKQLSFVEALISGGANPTITWDPVAGADQYRFRLYDPVGLTTLFDAKIYSDGRTSPYTYAYLGDLLSVNPNLLIFMEARDYLGDTGQLLNRSRTIYSSPVPVPPSVLLLGSGLIGLVGLRRRKFKK